MGMRIIRADITTLAVEAIVNAANERMLGGGGVDGAIHRAAGPELYKACLNVPEVRPGVRCPTGESRLTPGFRLPAKRIVHTAGPRYRDGLHNERKLLASCYESAIEIAYADGARTIAFPAISTGVYGYPKEEAACVAVTVCQDCLSRFPDLEVILCAFSDEDRDRYERLIGQMADRQEPSDSGRQMKPCSIEDRMKGLLWGLIVGDAFGSPIQFSSKDRHPWITEMVPCPIFHVPAGYWTDDGSMAMCVMDSFVRKGEYDLKDIGNTFYRWFKDGYLSSIDGRAFDIGRATANACQMIGVGQIYENGHEVSQGNGSIMRFAPSYLIARSLKRPEIIHEVSNLTHSSSVVRKTCDELAAVLDEHMVGNRAIKGPGKELDRADVPNSGWCVDTLTAALWAFNTTDSFEKGLIAAVNLGGDSDSIGAVFGQIAGAYYGYSEIPSRWVEAVKTWKEVDARIDAFLAQLSEMSVPSIAGSPKECQAKEP